MNHNQVLSLACYLGGSTNKRIEIIKRKRKAMQKFLRNDIADLLNNGLDSNAYGRVEGLYGEQNLTSCYEFVEQSCSLILSHLSAMNKQRECPEECKEAISSLIFAAARFADLSEVYLLRDMGIVLNLMSTKSLSRN